MLHKIYKEKKNLPQVPQGLTHIFKTTLFHVVHGNGANTTLTIMKGVTKSL
jgi:hypothetical protein